MVHKAQGLNAFSPKWIGSTYSNSLVNNDMAIIQYKTIGVKLDVHVNDYFIVNSTFADNDKNFVTGQGS